ncbi:MAG: hypothetical protein L6R41_002275 [Letrouitia leprolyta]|nr:MAG: hypothetical protein L6R41_002275 [Letrouitia leprolyta]
MASPTLDPHVIRIFHEIDTHIQTNYRLQADKKTPTLARLEYEKTRNPQLQYLTYHEYALYWAKIAYNDNDDEWESVPTYTVNQLWQKLYHSPLENSEQSNAFAKFIGHSFFPEIIDLGKLDGVTPCRLEPRPGLLKDLEENTFGDLSYSNVLAHAVAYAEGHPSQEEISLVVPSDDPVLRRFREIGNIKIKLPGRDWEMTGHVLVMDLDRDRHPWLILARTWDTHEEYPQTFTPSDIVMKNDTSALGVLPGNKNRTTIARFDSYPQSSTQAQPFLLRFGKDFQFTLRRSGKEITRAEQRSQFGPSLARIMTWFQRPNGEEVCFDEQRRVYMIRNPHTRQYKYPNPNFGAFQEQVGNFVGESQPIPLGARPGAPGGPSVGPSDQSRRRSGPTTSSAWE